MKKILLVNFFGILLIIILLEFISNFFKLSGLMGIQKGLVYEKDETHFLYPDKEGVIFDEKVFTDRYGYRVPCLLYTSPSPRDQRGSGVAGSG